MNTNNNNTETTGATTGSIGVETGTTMFEAAPVITMGSTTDTSTLNTDLADTGENMDKFLERPIVISTISWTSAYTATSIFPWNLWLADASIRRKLANYTYLSGNLNLRFEVNATPYHYGCLLACYMPNPFLNGNYDANIVKTLPNCFEQTHVEIEPNSNSVYEMKLPFVYNSRKFNVYRNEMKNLGVLSLVPWRYLSLSNSAASTTVTIRVYAWMTDVVLEAPTVGNVIKYQSIKTSRPPKLTTKARGLLDTAYDIGNTIIGWAEWLGFSRQPITPGYSLTTTRQHDFTNIEGEDNIQTLALTSKTQRPLYFPTRGDDNPDPLLITELCGREGLVYNTPIAWASTHPPDTVLACIPVTPGIWNYSAVAQGTDVYMPPCAYFSQRHRYWRGTLIFRVKVIASKQHSGKLRIYYDPLGGPSSFTAAPDDPQNTTRVYIMDIAAETSVEFTVGWCSDKPFLPLMTTTPSGLTYVNPSSPTVQFYPNANGFLTIESSSYLSTPLAAQGVSINVTVRAGDDFELMQPTSNDAFRDFLDLRAVTLQSGVFKRQFQPATKVELSKPQTCGDYASELCGERIVSWRPLLKRFAPEVVGPITNTWAASAGNYNEVFCSLGKYPAPQTAYGASYTGASTRKMPNMTLIGICFSGQRGGVKTKVLLPLCGNETTKLTDVVTIYRPTGPSPTGPGIQALIRNNGVTPTVYANTFLDIVNSTGAVVIDSLDEPNGTLFADYSNVLFEPNSLTRNYNSSVRSITQGRYIHMYMPNNQDGAMFAPMLMVAAADDYDVVAYTCTPRASFRALYTEPVYNQFL